MMKHLDPLSPRRGHSMSSNYSAASTIKVSHSPTSPTLSYQSSMQTPPASPRRRKTQRSDMSEIGNSQSNRSFSPKSGRTFSPKSGRSFSPKPVSPKSGVLLNAKMNPASRKTKIQVCVRLRPLLHSDRMSEESSDKRRHSRKTVLTLNNDRHSFNSSKSAWDIHSDRCTLSQASFTNPDTTRKNTFRFDHTFGPKQTTKELYEETVKDSIHAFMEGYHTSVFAYGQTATGKTFTMTGNKKSNNENNLGIIQLAIKDCFDHICNEESERREYLLRISFMEIYNEVVNDLLVAPTVSLKNINGVPPSAPSSIRIFESKKDGVIIRGLKEDIVTSYEEVIDLLAAGEKRRHTGGTFANKKSSRSHSIFRLTVESRARPNRNRSNGQALSDAASHESDSIASSVFVPGSSNGPVRVSTLSLVDLAGSESVKNTGSTGTRKKEGQYINKSLLTLGNVVWKLAELSTNRSGSDREDVSNLDSVHIPYRDSKLTRILQPSLSGKAQICLICNISPLMKHLEESHNTLKFASRAKRIKQNVTVNEICDEKTLLENYREEIDDLKRQLKEANEFKQEMSESSSSNSTEEENRQVIVKAINNLERLILKTATATEKKKKKRRKAEKKKNDALESSSPAVDNSTVDNTSVTSGISGDCDDDTLLNMLDDTEDIGEENDLVDNLSLVSKSNHLKTTSIGTKDDYSLYSKGETSLGDDTIIESKKLITELHRIQGLLGSVLVRNKGSPTKKEVDVEVADESLTAAPAKQFSLLSVKNEEVERLRSQLHEQAVATSLKQADSSFLQSQLQEKDFLLSEVSKILESVEQRQLQLDKENLQLKEEWAKSVSALRSKQNECDKAVQLLKAREAEIQQLRKQLED